MAFRSSLDLVLQSFCSPSCTIFDLLKFPSDFFTLCCMVFASPVLLLKYFGAIGICASTSFSYVEFILQLCLRQQRTSSPMLSRTLHDRVIQQVLCGSLLSLQCPAHYHLRHLPDYLICLPVLNVVSDMKTRSSVLNIWVVNVLLAVVISPTLVVCSSPPSW